MKDPTLALAADVAAEAVRFQGNWIPHRLRPATEDGVFFVGDSAGHCLPMTAEGIRTALYFGVYLGRELRAVLDGRQDVRHALRRYGEFSAGHSLQFACMYAAQQSVRRLHGPVMDGLVRAFGRRGCPSGRSGTTSTSRRPRRRFRLRLRVEPRCPQRPPRAVRERHFAPRTNANRASGALCTLSMPPLTFARATSRPRPRRRRRRAATAPPRAGSGPG